MPRTATQDEAKPRRNGDGLIFEIISAGMPVTCTISRGALEEVSGRRYVAAKDVIACFTAGWPAIEAAARGKLRARGESVTGCLRLWAEDFDTEPPAAPESAAQGVPL